MVVILASSDAGFQIDDVCDVEDCDVAGRDVEGPGCGVGDVEGSGCGIGDVEGLGSGVTVSLQNAAAMDVAHEASVMFWLVLVFTYGIQVLTTADNIARGRPTNQTGVLCDGSAEKGNDGNINGHFNDGRSCTHTGDSNYPWWAVDLQSERLVTSVHIYNRVDCCSERLHDIRVGLKDTWPTTNGSSAVAMDTICGTRDGPHPEARVVIECNGNAVGRYLVIEIHAVGGVLTLCEVEVFAVQPRRWEWLLNMSWKLSTADETNFQPLIAMPVATRESRLRFGKQNEHIKLTTTTIGPSATMTTVGPSAAMITVGPSAATTTI
ncbi:hypothetical protein LSAT2_007353 [Lamellibrachia satsuma]|nr:hypothetical protein LSAT2_007353 [Lamellibrachia satsuma]